MQLFGCANKRVSLIVTILISIIFVLWRVFSKRGSPPEPKKITTAPAATAFAAVSSLTCEKAADHTDTTALAAAHKDVAHSSLGSATVQTEPTAADTATAAEAPVDAAICSDEGKKSKRAEKKEKRKEIQKARDKEQPKVRTALDKYKSFIDACVAYAGMPEEEAKDEAFLEAVYPKHFECHGHVVVVQLNQHAALGPVSKNLVAASANTAAAADDSECVVANAKALEAFRRVACAFAKSLQSKPDVVVVDTLGIGGELRKPVHEIVWQDESVVEAVEISPTKKKGDNNAASSSTKTSSVAAASAAKCFAPIVSAAPKGRYDAYQPSTTFTTHIEKKTRYSFDVMRVMFSSGNTEIRMHFGTITEAKDEEVVDMFAGIGYFTMPLAIHGLPRMIHALEKNPDSAIYLQMNAFQNGVSDRVTVYCGDNRTVAGNSLDGSCDRVLMGYIPSCKGFIPKAVQFLKRRSFTEEKEDLVVVEVEEEEQATESAAPTPSPSPQRGGGRNSRKRNNKKKGASPQTTTEAVTAEQPAAKTCVTKTVTKTVTITKPVGVIHYHYLAGKDDAEAVALRDFEDMLAQGLVTCPPEEVASEESKEGNASDAAIVIGNEDHKALVAGTDYKVVSIFQVKSYSPKMWHYVADVAFGK